jgi:hypothetical protein
LSGKPHIVSDGVAGFQTTLGFKNVFDKRNPVSETWVDMARHFQCGGNGGHEAA